MFSYWYFVVLFFIVVFKYLQRNCTIRYIRFSFFFLEKIDCLIRVEKFHFIEYDVAIIIYVIFFFEFQTWKILMKLYFIKYLTNARDFILLKNLLRRSISVNFLRTHSVFKLFINEDFLIDAYNTKYRTFIKFHSIALIYQIFENWQQCLLLVIYQ